MPGGQDSSKDQSCESRKDAEKADRPSSRRYSDTRRTALKDKKDSTEKSAAQSQKMAEKPTGKDDLKSDPESASQEKTLEEEAKKEAERNQIMEQQAVEDEKAVVNDFITEARERLNQKEKLRLENEAAADNRPGDSFFSNLDSSMKKNSAFVRKVKNITESQKEAIIKDFNCLNLTKYVGEVAAALVEAKMKMSDISSAVLVSSLIHQRYADFSPAFLENWQRQLPLKKDDKVTNLSKLRVDLRFFAELVAVRVFPMKSGLTILSTLLSVLINNDKEENNNITILLSFCKHCGDDYCGLLPRKIRLLHEKHGIEEPIPRSTFLAAERQRACRNLMKDYFTSVSKHLVNVHRDIQQSERQNRKILMTKGELSQERKEKFEADQQAYLKLLSNSQQLADILDEDMVELSEYEPGSNDEFGLDIYTPLQPWQYDGDTALFEDEETRAFYETIPDLKSIVPGILYRDSENSVTDVQESSEQAADESLNVEDLEKELEEAEKEPVDKKEKEEEAPPTVIDILPETEDDDTNVSMKLILESFLNNLPNCVNRELIDRSSQDFCMNLNTKANRKKLVRALFTVHRTRYDLLPFYSRMVATLYPCMPDVANDLVTLLSGDFKWHVRKKDQINIESKLKTVRFIGELVKFKMFQKQDALHFLKMLLFDFSHHNIEMACALLESCGRFLYRSPDSHQRTKVYLDVVMRKKAALHMDSRYTTMIENAYYYSNPPDAKTVEKKVRPPLHEYIRKLLYKDLNKINVEKVLRQMRKLAWDDPDVSSYTLKCLISVWNVRFFNIHCLANLVAGLAPYHENLAIHVVDGVLEDVRLGMEINLPKFNQRRVSAAAYVGELYNYRLVESSVIFKTLYSFITYGVSYDETVPSVLDPPDHLFRIRLVCYLLDTCGQYFDRGSSKKKLDCFLVYFMSYYWMKKSMPVWTADRPFPLDVVNMLRDTLDQIRPKFIIPDSYEKALAQQEKLEAEYRAKLAELLPDKESDASLPAISETDEMEESGQNLSEVGLTDDESAESDVDDRSRSPSQVRQQESEGEDCLEGTPGSQEYSVETDDELETDNQDADVHLKTGLTRVQCEEDDDFMTAFDKMLQENMQNRSSEPVKVGQVDIGVPLHLRSAQKKSVPLVASSSGSGLLLETSPPEPPPANIHFTVLTKRGNKQQYAQIDVPRESKLAARFMETKEAEREEKERMKKVVLDIHERQEEEDYQEMIAGMTRQLPMLNINRDKRAKFQHPKGAPDADAIFGSGPKLAFQQGKR